MQVPVRLFVQLRPSVSLGIMLAVGFDTVVLVATPFLYNLVADHYQIGLTGASLIGVFQLGGFVFGSWGAGRWLRPRRRVFVAALALAAITNLVSVLLPPFGLLVGVRFVSGVSLGLISWFGWVQAFGDDQSMDDIAVAGPLAGVVAGPLIAAVIPLGGAEAIFALLGGLACVPLVLNHGTGASHRVPAHPPRTRPVPAAAALLLALCLFTAGGSAVFQFAVVLGTGQAGLAAGTVALMFSANAVASVPGARWPWRRGIPGLWMALTAACALVLCFGTHPALFAAAIVVWGFAFWMAVPGAFSVLAERSAHPTERAGDAQAMMAAGRVGGPFLGGVLLDASGPEALGLAGGGLILAAAVIVSGLKILVPPRPSEPEPEPWSEPEPGSFSNW